MDVPAVLIVLLLLAGFFIQLGIGMFYTYVQEVVSDSVAGTAIALLGLVSFSGAFSAPVFAGVIIERTGTYFVAFGYAGVLATVGVVLSLLEPEPNPRSIELSQQTSIDHHEVSNPRTGC